MYININITFTFMHISRFILVSKSTSFTFFIWTFIHSITFLHGRFVYIHTFFHRQIMCNCQLATCLYDIQQTSCERRLHHNHVMPSEPIWAEFASTLGRYTYSRFKPPRASKAAISVCAARAYYIYAHICRGKWWCCNPHTRTWENPARFFCAQSHYMYCILLGKM